MVHIITLLIVCVFDGMVHHAMGYTLTLCTKAVNGSSCLISCETSDNAVTSIRWNRGVDTYNVFKSSCDTVTTFPTEYEPNCTNSKFWINIASVSYYRDKKVWTCTDILGGNASPSKALDVLVPPEGNMSFIPAKVNDGEPVNVTCTTTLYTPNVTDGYIKVGVDRQTTSKYTTTQQSDGLSVTVITATATATAKEDVTVSCVVVYNGDTMTLAESPFNIKAEVSSIQLSTSRRVPVVGEEFVQTCDIQQTITETTYFIKAVGQTLTTAGACLADGRCSPPGVYTFALNTASNTVTLTITSVNKTRDSGTWRCIYNNIYDSNNVSLLQFTTLLNWSPVLPTSLPTSVTPQDSISVVMTTPCTEPAPVFTWTFQTSNGGTININVDTTVGSSTSCTGGLTSWTNSLSLPGGTTSLYNQQITLTLTVEHDSFDPRNNYRKSVTSSSIQFPVPVSSATLNGITSDNQVEERTEGQTVTLTCVTSHSFPASTVTWVSLPSGTSRTDSNQTSGVLVRTTSTVSFTASSSDDDRRIHCTASNINGQPTRQSYTVRLRVWYGPDTVVVSKPGDLVSETVDLTLTCTAAANPGVTYNWQYEGQTTAIGTSQTVTIRPSRQRLVIKCTATNTKSAKTQSGTINLTDIKYPPSSPTITGFPSPMYAGDQMDLTCTVSGGNPPATSIVWSCSGRSETSRQSGSSSKTATLSIRVTKTDDNRQCQCSVTWPHPGYTGEVSRSMTVYYPPDTPTITDPGTLCQGQSKTLTCSSPDSGSPSSTYYWYKAGESVDTGSTYTITSVGRSDDGATIYCTAGNSYTDRAVISRPRSETRTLSVYYLDQPVISPSNSLTKKEGDSLSLTCTTDSKPSPATITWTLDTSTISSSSNVDKTNLSRSDQGQYTCTGRVNTGSVCPGNRLERTASVTVTVQCTYTNLYINISTGRFVYINSSCTLNFNSCSVYVNTNFNTCHTTVHVLIPIDFIL